MMVAMLESIQDDPAEVAQFEVQIPSVARALIPVWRSQFYRPRSQCLEELLR